jgi:Mce-associated membrane protein
MSPRRKVQPGERPLFDEPVPKRSPRLGLPLVTTVATLVVVAAVTVCTLILITHEKRHRAMVKDVEVLGYVRMFIVDYTSLDPFHANDYADRVLSYATGDFATQYKQRENEIVVRVARAEPTKGTVLDAGIERWNDDGSADVVTATNVTSKSPDGKTTIENASRWVVTAEREGEQWKISNLKQLI